MLAWQQYQRLKFEFKERGLPLDGSYKPPVPAGGFPPRAVQKAAASESGLYRSTSVPVLNSDAGPRSVGLPKAGQKPLQRGMSGALNKPRNGSVAPAPGAGWARASSPSIDMGSPNSPGTRPKSGSFTVAGRRASVSVSSEVAKVKSMADTFEKAKQHLNDGLFEKAMSCYSEVVVETLAQRALCLIQLDEFPEAVVNCDFALHFKPGHGKALIRKAKALVKLDRAAEAKACRAVAMPYLKPNDPELWEVGIMLGLNEGVPPPQPEEEQQIASPEKSSEDERAEEAAAAEPARGVSPRAAAPHQGTKEPVAPDATPSSPTPAGRGRGSGAGLAARSPSGGRGLGTPLTQRKNDAAAVTATSPPEPVGESPLSPTAAKKVLPAPPGGLTGPRASGGLKKPSLPAPVAPKRFSAAPDTPVVAADLLDVNLDYAEMEDAALPPLPSEPPTIDEDMLRWQQYQRLKTEYKDRNLEPKFA